MRLHLAMPMLIAAAFLLAAQPTARLHTLPEPNQQHTYRIETRFELASDGQTATLEQDAHVRLVTVSAEPDGSAIVRATVDRVTVVSRSPGDEAKYAHPPQDEEVPDADLARIYDMLTSAVVEFVIDPRGRPTLTSGLDRTLTAAEGFEGVDGVRLLGIFGPGAMERMMSQIWTLDSTRAERRPGDTWNESHTQRVFGRRETRITTTYTLKGFADDIAVVDGDLKVVLLPPARPDPTAPRLELVEQSGTTSARWDSGAGRLVSRTTETRLKWSASVAAEPPITSEAVASSRVKITLLGQRGSPVR